MKHTFAELSCIALLWIGTAGIVASLYIDGTHAMQLQSLCEFAAVIALGCVAKILIGRDKSLNAALI